MLVTLALHSPATGKLSAAGMTRLRRFRWPALALIAWNCIALFAISFIPAWTPLKFQEEIHRLTKNELLQELHYQDQNPYHILGIPMNFYRPAGLSLVQVKSYADLLEKIGKASEKDLAVWFFHPRFSLPAEARVLERYCSVEFRTLPGWIEQLNFNGWLDRVSSWTLYHCEKPQ